MAGSDLDVTQQRCSTSTASASRFDGFKALNKLSLDGRAGRDARHHRPERRRQDHDDGRHHRQDAAGRRRRLLRRQARPDPARRGRDRPARHRPQIPEADGVREPDGAGQSRAGAEGRRARRARRCSASAIAAATSASTRSCERIRLCSSATGRPAICPTARSNGSRSACCWHRTRSCCSSTSPSPA